MWYNFINTCSPSLPPRWRGCVLSARPSTPAARCTTARGGGRAVATEAGDDPLVGTVLGERYFIEGYLKRGGMGTVYRGRHLLLNQQIAVKVLHIIPDRETQERFLLEARTACSIGHLNIVRISDFGVLPDRRPFLVMEYLAGQSLEDLISQHQMGLSPLRVCRIGEQVALGMQAVHDKNIVHRDLKPGNVCVLDVDGKDFVKILDFGIAKVMSGQRATLAEFRSTPRLTQDGMVLGTAWYMAPEQARGEVVDYRVDQYALGCILYEMLTGQVPFDAPDGNPMAIMLKQMYQEPVPPRVLQPGIPGSLEEVVLRSMSKDRDRRYPSMRELAAALLREAEVLGARDTERTVPVNRCAELEEVSGIMALASDGEEEEHTEVKPAAWLSGRDIGATREERPIALPGVREREEELAREAAGDEEEHTEVKPAAWLSGRDIGATREERPIALPGVREREEELAREAAGDLVSRERALPAADLVVAPAGVPSMVTANLGGRRRWLRPALLGGGGAALGLVLYLALVGASGSRQRTPPGALPDPEVEAPLPEPGGEGEQVETQAETVVPSGAGGPDTEESFSARGKSPSPGQAGVRGQSPLRVFFANASRVSLMVSCSGLPQASLGPGGVHRMNIAPGKKGACVFSARGYEDQTFSYLDLRGRARGNVVNVSVRLRPL